MNGPGLLDSGPYERLPEDAFALGLSMLPGIGPATLARLLADYSPAVLWQQVLDGELERPVSARTADGGRRMQPWSAVARSFALAREWSTCQAGQIRVTWTGRPDFPARLIADCQPCGVLFWRGDLRWLNRPCVAVIGTRQASSDGRRIAHQLGYDLAAAGVCVVSGLALGIDGAAHLGALAAGGAAPAGVVASGLDVAYPKRHAGLWEQVATAGLLVSETPPGGSPQAWRFPMRNRLIAALVRTVVIVESHERGGSLLTVDAALARGVEVAVVPGPVLASASAGSNRLLLDGATPVCSAQDVLDGLGLGASGRGSDRTKPSSDRSAVLLSPTALDVLDALGRRPSSFGQVVERCGLTPAEVSELLHVLDCEGFADQDNGWWTRSVRER